VFFITNPAVRRHRSFGNARLPVPSIARKQQNFGLSIGRLTAVQNFISRFRVADEKLLDLCAQPFGAEFAILRVLTKSFQLEESAVS
jgi:hypothetical protein